VLIGRAINPERLRHDKLLIDPQTERVLGVGSSGLSERGEMIAEGRACIRDGWIGQSVAPESSTAPDLRNGDGSSLNFYGTSTHIFARSGDELLAPRNACRYFDTMSLPR